MGDGDDGQADDDDQGAHHVEHNRQQGQQAQQLHANGVEQAVHQDEGCAEWGGVFAAARGWGEVGPGGSATGGTGWRAGEGMRAMPLGGGVPQQGRCSAAGCTPSALLLR